jgi:NADPH:quinone reductase-like Zn-dependent oxidoreductase
LDIEDDPVGQGFEAESYDVVLAVNVLHATRHISKTLENCRRLLKPGGNLVLGESTNTNDIGPFIFGTLPGWWVAEDGRENGPLLSQSQWDEALKKAGFSGTDTKLAEIDDPDSHRMSILVSTRQEEQGFPSKDIMVVTPDDCTNPIGSLASLIRQEFERLGSAVEIKDLQAATTNANGKTVISLLEYEKPFFEEVQAVQFEQAKHILLHGSELLWATRSDPNDGPGHPSKRAISGLLRCLKTEDASRRLYEFHFCRDLTTDLDSAARTICRRFRSFGGAKQNRPDEMETVEQNGTFCIPRYIPEKILNRCLSLRESGAVPEVGDLIQPKRPLKLTIGRPGMLDTLHFVDDETPFQPLLDEEVQIEVKACAMNFLDIMIAMGQIQRPVLGYEASGIINRVGAKVTKFKQGDRVIYMGQGAMRTALRSHESYVHALPTNLTFEEGVTIPIAYATAYQSLIEVARLQKGESVLIHAAAGGLGQALIQISKLLKADIFCTVGSNAKKQAVIDLGVQPDRIFSSRDLSFAKGIKRVTQGRGVDVVVNSLAGEALRKSWDCLADYGRFIEVGKKDILGNSGLDMRPFLKNTLFAGVNLEQMMVANPHRSSKLVSEVLKLFEQGSISPIQPITAYEFTDMESVFRKMQRGAHIGKLVLRVTTESRVPVIPRQSIHLNLDSDSTYLLVGGLGGLGRAQALFMAEHGARHMAFISRSGDARPEAKDLLEKLTAIGVDAKSYAGDVADKSQVKNILTQITANMPPIRGAIQGAMVLDDGLFHKMTFDQWVTATRPKIQGSWNLHELLPQNLDFFILLSSLAGIVGSISQANYAAGNTYQDALVNYRHAKGLPAQSIDLGLIKGAGYVEEHKEVAANTSSLKFTSIEADQFLHILGSALAGTADGEHPLPPQLLVGARSGGAIQATRAAGIEGDCYWLRTLPQFAYLQEMDVQAASTTEGQSSSNSLIAQLGRSASMDEAAEIVQAILLTKVAKIIMTAVTDIDASKPIYTYGVDSLVAVELRNWVALELKSDISIFDLTSNTPITEVCKKIAGKSQIVLEVEGKADGV